MTTLFFLMAVTSSPWSVPTVQTTVRTEPASIEPTWTRLAVPVSLPTEPYAEIHYWKIGRDEKDVHEQSHLVMNWFSNSWGLYSKKQQAFYCLSGKIAIINEPPFTMKDILAADPGVLNLVSKWRYWNSQPLYILNEWVAYSNEWDWDHSDIGIKNAKRLSQTAAIVLSIADKCAGYDATQLRAFVKWHTARVDKQGSEIGLHVKSVPTSQFWQNRATANGQYCPSGTCPNSR